jgi:hypothetical protein
MGIEIKRVKKHTVSAKQKSAKHEPHDVFVPVIIKETDLSESEKEQRYRKFIEAMAELLIADILKYPDR